MTSKSPPTHPGQYVKEHLLPEGMSVTKAAEKLGVGRPALSNFLNGNASLSHNMASRLAQAFSVSKDKLLELQQEYDSYLNQEEEKKLVVKKITPSFLKITATQIEAWADAIDARSLLPALLRRLVNTTGAEIVSSDFPAFDNSQRRGWDGLVESNTVTSWIPSGVSGWEFGCNKTPKVKANSDYQNRTKAIPEAERKNITFIFVTPRNWQGKNEWVRSVKAKNEWKDARAFDASDLEQWLEVSVPGQVWFAEQINLPTKDCESLTSYWHRWSHSANPVISQKIFNSNIKDCSKTFIEWYREKPVKPFVVTAASKEEAMAFLSCITEQVEELYQLNEQAIFVSTAEAVKRLANISAEFIPVACTDDAQNELSASFGDRPAIIISERNIKGVKADVRVELPGYEYFKEALVEMGFDDAEIEVYKNRSGKSPTILRRQLARIPAVRKPTWASTPERIRQVIPLVLAGTWNSAQEGDQDILSILSDTEYDAVEKSVAELVSLDDSPIWSESSYRGVISKLDCFLAASDLITEAEIKRFMEVAEYVLSEDDPALDLEKEERWAAVIHKKVREHSPAIRKSICENLIILAVHGNGLFKQRLGINVEDRVSFLVRSLLKDKDARTWQAQQDVLLNYAEAAPEEFLSILEEELRKDEPAFKPLFESVSPGAFSKCERTGVLWALELLAWNPDYLSRVVAILGKLSTYEIEDNWVNKPINSIVDILLVWKPHTAATLEQRGEVLEMLCEKFPEIGWEICIGPLKRNSGFTSGTHKPDWRSYASGAGHVVTNKEARDFVLKCLEIVLAWPEHNKNTLKDLISCLSGFPDDARQKVKDEVKKWVKSSPPDEDIIFLREHIRTQTLTSRARKRQKGDHEKYANGKELYDLLEPSDPLLRHLWLFAKDWIEYTPEELEEEDLDFEERDKRLDEQRLTALKEILTKHGRQGLIKLISKGRASYRIGVMVIKNNLVHGELRNFILELFSSTDIKFEADRCISGMLWCLEADVRKGIMEDVISALSEDEERIEKISRLFMCAPFERETWRYLDSHGNDISTLYWKSVYPGYNREASEADINYALKKLLDVKRPRAAFDYAHLMFKSVSSKMIIRLLNEIATTVDDSDSQYSPSQYEIEEAFMTLDKRDDFDRNELARLEFAYVEAFHFNSRYGLPNLSKEVANSPLLFIQLISYCFKRKDDLSDPEEWGKPKDEEHKKNLGTRAYHALETINFIPGTDEKKGEIEVEKLLQWMKGVRDLAKEHAREGITDERIGKLLSTCPPDETGMWPREEIQIVLEEIASTDISTGMEIGLRNSGGAEFHEVDSSRERNTAQHYRELAAKVKNKRPFVGKMLLSIADSYERDAEWWDRDARVNKRVRGW